jgi:aspartate/glutamate racemase
MHTHLKISTGALVIMRESQWQALLERARGHIVIAAGARLIIIPDDTPHDWIKEVARHV